MKIGAVLLSVLSMLLLSACDYGPQSSYGFTLPEGNAEYGKIYFVEFRCIDCHTVAGIEDELNAPEGIDPLMNVPLGGEKARIATYGELVTSIINPSHKVSERYRLSPSMDEDVSPMRNYNTIMTVDELIDIVAFVQSHYELKPLPPTVYKVY